MAFVQRDETFAAGGHSFPACEVCADGRWRRGNQWVGRSSRAEVEAKFGKWADHLYRCVAVSSAAAGEEEEEAGDQAGDKAASGGGGGGKATLETHRVQERWFQNAFVFSSRPFAADAPAAVVEYEEEQRRRRGRAQEAAAAAAAAETAVAAAAAAAPQPA